MKKQHNICFSVVYLAHMPWPGYHCLVSGFGSILFDQYLLLGNFKCYVCLLLLPLEHVLPQGDIYNTPIQPYIWCDEKQLNICLSVLYLAHSANMPWPAYHCLVSGFRSTLFDQYLLLGNYKCYVSACNYHLNMFYDRVTYTIQPYSHTLGVMKNSITFVCQFYIWHIVPIGLGQHTIASFQAFGQVCLTNIFYQVITNAMSVPVTTTCTCSTIW